MPHHLLRQSICARLRRSFTTSPATAAVAALRILVPCKRVIDYAVRPRVLADNSGIDRAGVKHSLNPFDEIAVEEALRIRERLCSTAENGGRSAAITAISIGTDESLDVLKTALAMGADDAILIDAHKSGPALFPIDIAHALAAIVKRVDAALVLMGKQAIDDDCGQTGPMLAALLDWPIVELDSSNSTLRVTREVEGGLQVVQCSLPAVVTTDLRLNEPRYATLPNIMRARSKPVTRLGIDEVLPTDKRPSVATRMRVVRVEEAATRGRGKVVGSVEELVKHLKADRLI